MNEARLRQMPFWGPREAVLFLIERLVSLPKRLAFKFESSLVTRRQFARIARRCAC